MADIGREGSFMRVEQREQIFEVRLNFHNIVFSENQPRPAVLR
jgi:hypothetical protein